MAPGGGSNVDDLGHGKKPDRVPVSKLHTDRDRPIGNNTISDFPSDHLALRALSQNPDLEF